MKTLKLTFSVAVGIILVFSLLTQTWSTAPAQARQDPQLKAAQFDTTTKTALQDFKQVGMGSVTKKLQSTTISDTDKSKLAKLALPFIQNIGQVNSQVRYYATTFAGNIFVTSQGLRYSFVQHDFKPSSNADTKIRGVIVDERFIGSQGTINPQGIDRSSSQVSYFVGNKDSWKSNAPTYNALSLGQVWPQVDLTLKAYGKNIEKIFTIQPGGNVNSIRAALDGINSISVDKDGRLLIGTQLGTVSMSIPVAYQEINGVRHGIDVSYVISGNSYGFTIGDYDKHYPLIIDPLLASISVGATSLDFTTGMVRDSAGNVYITGYAGSPNYPTTADAYRTTFDTTCYSCGPESQTFLSNFFVSKLDPALSSLLASTFIGTSEDDWSPTAIALDSSGNVYITGWALQNYPTTPGAYNTAQGPKFVSKLDPSLSSLLASTFAGVGAGNAIAIDSSGNVYTVGTGVSKFNPSLSSLLALSSIGGVSFVPGKVGQALSFDGSSGTVLVPNSPSLNFGSTGSFSISLWMKSTQSGTGNPGSGWLVDHRRNNDGTYQGYSIDDTSGIIDARIRDGSANDVVVSSTTNVNDGNFHYVVFVVDRSSQTEQLYIDNSLQASAGIATVGSLDTSFDLDLGGTASPNTLVNFFAGTMDQVRIYNGALSTSDIQSLFNEGGSTLPTVPLAAEWKFENNVLDTSGNNNNGLTTGGGGGGNAITLDSSGNVYTTGGGVGVYKYNSMLSLLASNSPGTGTATAIALDSSGNVYITGHTWDSNYPTTAGAYQRTFRGSQYAFEGDAFISKLNPSLSSILASTFIGGSSNDEPSSIALDSAGNVYITGRTLSSNYPTTACAYETTFTAPNYGSFISKLNPSLSSLSASTFFNRGSASAIALDSSGDVFVAGYDYPFVSEITGDLSSGTCPSAPTSPTGLTATAVSSSQIKLSWQAPSSDGGSPITNYRIFRSTSSGTETIIGTVGNVNSYTNTGLTSGVTYFYKVKAVTALGSSPLSNEASATPTGPLSAPQNLQATAGSTSVALSWQAPSSDGGSPITNYRIFRSTSSGTETIIGTVGNVNFYTNTGLTNGITYFYKVKAVTALGSSPLSNEASAMPT